MRVIAMLEIEDSFIYQRPRSGTWTRAGAKAGARKDTALRNGDPR